MISDRTQCLGKTCSSAECFHDTAWSSARREAKTVSEVAKVSEELPAFEHRMAASNIGEPYTLPTFLKEKGRDVGHMVQGLLAMVASKAALCFPPKQPFFELCIQQELKSLYQMLDLTLY